METHTIYRSGAAPLQFEGEVVASADSRTHNGPCQNRWHTLTAYRHQDGRLLLKIAFTTLWEGEHDRCGVEVCADAAELRRALSAIDPLADLIGLPPGAQFDQKRARIEKQLRQCWDAAVSDILAGFPEKI